MMLRMPAYIILNIEVTDPERFAEYVRTGAPTLAQYGGRYLARGGRAEKLEGGLEPKRVVVIAFDTVDRARAWWSSNEYAGPKAIRQSAALTDTILVEGV
jgi:uncharacterized protein (DUF1330 family)